MNELTILWKELTFLWNEITFLWNEVTWNYLTMERNDRKPIEYTKKRYYVSMECTDVAGFTFAM